MAHAEIVRVPDAQRKQLTFLARQIAAGKELNAHAANLFNQITGMTYQHGVTAASDLDAFLGDYARSVVRQRLPIFTLTLHNEDTAL